jgi:hypothetical protein
MPIVYQKWIRREHLRNNPRDIYVFGDNAIRQGLGGQAKEMRGEPNAIGVAVKWGPNNHPISFFKDDEICFNTVKEDLSRVEAYLGRGDVVVVPEDGIGTGRAQLERFAPKLDQFIKQWFKDRTWSFKDRS